MPKTKKCRKLNVQKFKTTGLNFLYIKIFYLSLRLNHFVKELIIFKFRGLPLFYDLVINCLTNFSIDKLMVSFRTSKLMVNFSTGKLCFWFKSLTYLARFSIGQLSFLSTSQVFRAPYSNSHCCVQRSLNVSM